MTTLPAAFALSAARNSDRVALTSGQTHLSYGELAARVRTVAKGLIASGLRHGDRVGVWAVNRIEWPIVGLAVQSVGGVVVLVSTRLKAGEVATIMRRAASWFSPRRSSGARMRKRRCWAFTVWSPNFFEVILSCGPPLGDLRSDGRVCRFNTCWRGTAGGWMSSAVCK